MGNLKNSVYINIREIKKVFPKIRNSISRSKDGKNRAGSGVIFSGIGP